MKAAVFFGFVVGLALSAPCSKRVLVAMASADSIELTNGSSTFNVTIGFYLDELMIPLQSYLTAGWTPTFANPQGNRPPLDPRSNQSFYFDPLNPVHAEQAFNTAWATLAGLDAAFSKPFTYSSLTNDALDSAGFDALFIPGGHAPMVSMWKDPNLGRIINWFVDAGKPIAAICHAPVALLSAGLVRSPWPFTNRTLTVFSTPGEKLNEERWGGRLPWYPEDKLRAAGAIVEERGPEPYMPHVVRDLTASPSLVTGQNPFSAPDLAAMVVDQLYTECK